MVCLFVCFLHINRSGLNHTQYYKWLPIRYVVVTYKPVAITILAFFKIRFARNTTKEIVFRAPFARCPKTTYFVLFQIVPIVMGTQDRPEHRNPLVSVLTYLCSGRYGAQNVISGPLKFLGPRQNCPDTHKLKNKNKNAQRVEND